MGKEIERKFLVIDDSYKSMAIQSYEISQGYLSRNPERVVRVRIKGENGFLTIKGKTFGFERLEFEYEIPVADARQMMSLCEGRVVEKRRWIVEYEGKIWEVDEFAGELSPMVVAEIELQSATEQFAVPSFIGKEVTGDPRYYNSNL